MFLRRGFLYKPKISSTILNYLPFIWTNLNSFHPVVLYVKLSWNRPSGSWKEDENMKFTTTTTPTTTPTTTDNGQILIRKAHLSILLRWTKKLYELNVHYKWKCKYYKRLTIKGLQVSFYKKNYNFLNLELKYLVDDLKLLWHFYPLPIIFMNVFQTSKNKKVGKQLEDSQIRVYTSKGSFKMQTWDTEVSTKGLWCSCDCQCLRASNYSCSHYIHIS